MDCPFIVFTLKSNEKGTTLVYEIRNCLKLEVVSCGKPSDTDRVWLYIYTISNTKCGVYVTSPKSLYLIWI